jgi:hypothetical protein
VSVEVEVSCIVFRGRDDIDAELAIGSGEWSYGRSQRFITAGQRSWVPEFLHHGMDRLGRAEKQCADFMSLLVFELVRQRNVLIRKGCTGLIALAIINLDQSPKLKRNRNSGQHYSLLRKYLPQ